MGGIIETDLTFFTGATGGISNCDSTTDWSISGTSVGVDTVQYVQGTGSLYSYSASASTTRYFEFSCVSTNVKGKSIYFWFALGKVGWLKTKAEGGLQLTLTDSAGNYATWNVAGSDTLPHNGFICHVVHTDVPPDIVSATPPDLTKIVKIRITANGSFPGKSYLWLDAVRYGTYLRIKGGNSTSPATFDDIYNAEIQAANRWGVLDKVNGIFFVQGKIIIGSSTLGDSTYFKDKNQVVVFKYGIVPDGFYELRLEGNPNGTTCVYFGEKVGERGVSGIVFRTAPGAKPFVFNASNQYINELGIYGSSFFDASNVYLPSYSDKREVNSCTFESCKPVYVSTCTVKYCNFISADDAGIVVDSTDFKVTNSNFVNCPYGVRITTSGTYTFDGLIFSGNTYDIDNVSGGKVTINCINGSNPTTYTGDTEIVLAVPVKVKVVDSSLNPIANASVYVYNLNDRTVIMNSVTDINGEASTSVRYTGDKNLLINVRKSTPPEKRYLPVTTYGLLTSNGFSTTVVMYEDTVAT
jgi:hypothetical protein